MRLCRRSPIRLFHGMLLATAAGIALLPAGCGKKTAPQDPTTDGGKTVADVKPAVGKTVADTKPGDEKPANKTSADTDVPKAATAEPGTPEAEVYAALDGAIATAKKYDIKTFFDLYMPVEELQMARRRYGGTAAMAKYLALKPALLKELFDNQLLPMVEGARRSKPEFNSDKTVARFKVITTAASVIKLESSPLLVERNKDPKVSGYGDDLKAALTSAVADLEGGQVVPYLASMLPVSELKLNDVPALAKQLKASPAVTKQMIADLKLLAARAPKLEQGGTLAVFEVVVESPPVGKRDRQPKPVMRVFKFQKHGGHWRLFDNTTAMQKTSRELSRKLGESSETVTMEKIGTHWRFSSEAERFGGKTADKTRAYKTEYKTYDKTGERREYRKTPYRPRRRSEKTPAKTFSKTKD